MARGSPQQSAPPTHRQDRSPERRDPAYLAYQGFIGACRRFWAEPLFQALRRQVETATGDPSALERHPTHQAFAWLERHLQRLKYSGRWGLVPVLEERREVLLAELAKPLPAGLLTLNPDIEFPAYYRAFDIHQHPGGLGGDALAGVVYREGAGLSGGVVGKPGLHDRFARLALEHRRPGQILDMGCGFGKSTQAFASAMPGAGVLGIDLSEACLRLAAHQTLGALRSRVKFCQSDASASALPDGSFDMVTSTMLLHEMPAEVIARLVTESARLLAPGGVAIHLDFLPPTDPFLRTIYDGHSRRNNEPFLLEVGRLDLLTVHTGAGFRNVTIRDFAEEDGALDAPDHKWRLPWTMIVAEK